MPALALPGLRHKVEPRVLGAESQCKTRFFYFNYVLTVRSFSRGFWKIPTQLRIDRGCEL